VRHDLVLSIERRVQVILDIATVIEVEPVMSISVRFQMRRSPSPSPVFLF